MRYLLPGDVYETALKRTRWLFDEFDKVTVSCSGGKDSTVVVNLALQVARERDRLPLTVVWLDQECENETTVDYQRLLAADPDINFRWYQIPFRLFNATSNDAAHSWLNVWGEGEEWVREKEPDSIHVNTLGKDRFVDCLLAIGDREAPNGVVLTGVRAEESPTRRQGLYTWPTYKWATWGGRGAGCHHVYMHPIYDWTYHDVWKAIHDGGWAYNRLYDFMHQYGVPHRFMRVSNYHHETAVKTLFWLQEVEPETWDRATRRVAGIATAGRLDRDAYFVKELPFVFASWREYRDYLLEHLVTDRTQRGKFRQIFQAYGHRMPYVEPERLARLGVSAILANDYHSTKFENFYVVERGKYVRERDRLAKRG